MPLDRREALLALADRHDMTIRQGLGALGEVVKSARRSGWRFPNEPRSPCWQTGAPGQGIRRRRPSPMT